MKTSGRALIAWAVVMAFAPIAATLSACAPVSPTAPVTQVRSDEMPYPTTAGQTDPGFLQFCSTHPGSGTCQ